MASMNRKARLIRYFLQCRAHGLQYRQHFEQQWRENWIGYMNLTKRGAQDRIPNEHFTYHHRLATEFRVIETLVAQYGLGLFHVPNWLGVSSPTGPGRFYDELVQSLLRGGWDRADGNVKVLDAIKYGSITGHSVFKVFWERTVQDREHISLPAADYEGNPFDPKALVRSTKPGVVFDGPQFYMVDLFNFVFDPTGSDMWAMERRTVKKSWLKWRNAQYGGKLYDGRELNSVKAAKPMDASQNLGGFVDSNGSWTSGPWDSAQLIEYSEGIPEQRDPDSVDKWEFYAWIPPELNRYDDTQWRLIEIVNDEHLIRDIPAPTPDRRTPYIHDPAIPVPGRLYGLSVLTQAQGLIRQQQFFENARSEEVAQKLWNPTIIDANLGLSPERLFRKPGGVLFVEGLTGRIQDHIQPAPQADVMFSAVNEPELKDNQVSRLAGATDPFEGNPAGGRTTATEIQIIAQLGSSRHQLAIFNHGDRGIRPILKKFFHLYQSRLTQAQLVELAGKPRRQYEVDLNALQWDIDIKLDVGRYGSFDEQQFQRMIQLYQVTAADPLATQFLDRGSLLYDMFMRAGDPNVAHHIKTEQAVEAENARMAEQMAAQQEQQIEGQQRIDINRELARGLAQSAGGGGSAGTVGEGMAGSLL